MRAIDADSLIADCNKYLGILNPDRDVKEYARIFWLIGILRNAPTIEPEIVRCKDCKWFHDIGCAIRIVDDSDKPSENDYCSFAERRTDGVDTM